MTRHDRTFEDQPPKSSAETALPTFRSHRVEIDPRPADRPRPVDEPMPSQGKRFESIFNTVMSGRR